MCCGGKVLGIFVEPEVCVDMTHCLLTVISCRCILLFCDVLYFQSGLLFPLSFLCFYFDLIFAWSHRICEIIVLLSSL